MSSKNIDIEENISNVRAQPKQYNVWQHFEKIVNETTGIVDRTKCLYCAKMLVFNVTNGTSSMHKHLSSCKKRLSNVDKSQTLISTFKTTNKERAESSMISTWRFNQEVSRQLLAEMIIIMEEPFRMVEQPPFRRFLSSLQPLWSDISRNTLAMDVVKRFDSEKVLLKNKVSTIIVDNASANDVAIAYLKGKLALLLDGEFFHMRCTAHIMNLIVKDGFSETKDCISRIRNSVKYVRSSPTRSETFQRCVKEERIAYKGGVCLDVATRWNSTYLMLDVALKFRKAFQRLEDEDPNYVIDLSHDPPSNEDWEKANVFAKFLRKFYEATNKMLRSNYVTSNSYFQETIGIVLCLNEWEKDTNPVLNNMSMKMKEKFDKYYGSVDRSNMMVLIAAVLDPQFKIKYVEWGYKKIYGNDFQKVGLMYGKLRDLLQRLYDFYVEVVSSFQESQVSTSSQPTEIGQSSVTGVSCDDSDYDPSLDEYEEEMKIEVHDMTKSELEIYLEEKCLLVKSNLNILDWWKVNAVTYKVLSHMARDVFAIPVSTVASESAFSTSGRVLDQFWSSLSTPVVEALVCTHDWLRYAYTPATFEDYLMDAESYDLEINAHDASNLEHGV
ncbi:zinc finger BED domain-containing protein RICESLEEPER 2-like [Pistacia vera]|uniref:zinc finger BED domain-containing protein RICESLEEPER 2-like n=1 Tax=Pistacia vera TaxID=55513 RepID=UPI00126349F7|nr:zinc finger BED domain-containing protein RICESLEEPER 2-like [Pistacia vera]